MYTASSPRALLLLCVFPGRGVLGWVGWAGAIAEEQFCACLPGVRAQADGEVAGGHSGHGHQRAGRQERGWRRAPTMGSTAEQASRNLEVRIRPSGPRTSASAANAGSSMLPWV